MFKLFMLLLLTTILYSSSQIEHMYNLKKIELNKINIYSKKMKGLLYLENHIKNIILNKIKSDETILASLLLKNSNNNFFISKFEVSNSATENSQEYKDFTKNFGFSYFFSNTDSQKIKERRFVYSDTPLIIDYNNKGFEICNIIGEDKDSSIPKFVSDYYFNNSSLRDGTYFFNKYTTNNAGPNLNKKNCIFYIYPKSLKEGSSSSNQLKKYGVNTYFADECLKSSQNNKAIIIKDGPYIKVGTCKNKTFNFLRNLGSIPNIIKPIKTENNNSIDRYKYMNEYSVNSIIDLEEYSKQFSVLDEKEKNGLNLFHFISRNGDLNKPNFIGGTYSFNKLENANKGLLRSITLENTNIKYPYRIIMPGYEESLYLKPPCTNQNQKNNCTLFLLNVEKYELDTQGIFNNANLSSSNGYIYNNTTLLNYPGSLNNQEHTNAKKYNLFFSKKNNIKRIYKNDTAGLSFKKLNIHWNDISEINGHGSFSTPFLLDFKD